MNFCKRLGQYQIIFGFFALCLFAACGGGSSSTTSSTTTGNSLTGTIVSPSASSSSISALVKPGVAFLTETPVSASEVSCYSTEGILVGTATTATDGTFTIEIDTNEVVEGDTVIIESDAGIAGLATIDSTLAAGTIDFDATLALEELKNKLIEAGISFTSWAGFNLDGQTLDFNPKCAFIMAKEKWGGAEATASGLAGQISYMKNMMGAAVIGGDLGSYGNLGDMAQAFFNDEVDESFVSNAASYAETYIGGDASSYTSAYTTAIDANNAVTDAFATYYAGGAGIGSTSTASVNAAVSVAEDSFCDEILNDDSLGTNAVLTMLQGSTDATTFITNYAGDSKATGLTTTFQKWKGDDGAYVFDESFHPAAFGGMWESAVVGGYDIDPDNMFNLMGEFQLVDGVDPHSWGGIVGMTYFADPTIDVTQVASWGGTQVLGGFQFDVYDDSITGANYTTSFTSAIATGQDFGTCLTNPDGCSTLFESDDFQISGMTYSTPTYNSTAVCGNGTCEGGESGTTCSFDCFSQTQAYTSGFTYESPDDFTMIMEGAPTAPTSPTGPTPTGPTPTGPMTMP